MIRRAIILFVCFLIPSVTFAQKIRILGFGSSFMEDAFYRMPELLEADTARVELAFLYKSGGSLTDHIDLMRSQQPAYTYFKYNNVSGQWDKHEGFNSRQALLEHDWDIIVLQQSASESGLYCSVEKTLAPLIDSIRHYQPAARLAWHMTWAFARNSTHPAFAEHYDRSQQLMYYRIISVASRIYRDDFSNDFQYLMPSGPVIQSLRQSELNDEHDFCRDGFHIDLNLGRYALACSTYESLLADTLHLDVRQVQATVTEDSVHTEADYDLIRNVVYDICHDTDSLVWSYIKDDRVYSRRYYNLQGAPLCDSPERSVVVRQERFESGRVSSKLIYKKE